jgi:glycosyltransferase involved in cell wall biosynthesis
MTANSDERHSISFVVLWQSLVISTYRSMWRQLSLLPHWSVTMIGPDQFREGGMQDLKSAANDPRNPTLIELPVIRKHAQIVLFRGLTQALRGWLQKPQPVKIFFCFAEPYSVTAFMGYLSFWIARLLTPSNAEKPKFMLYGFQNIYKSFSFPMNFIQRLMFRVVDAIFVTGSDHESVLRKQGYQGPCIQLPMWFDPEIFYVSPTIQTKEIHVGFAGSLVPEKGILQLLQWIQKNPTAVAQCNLSIVGQGPLKAQIEALVTSMNAEHINVQFLGPIPPHQMPDFYRSLDILVVPSLTASHWKEQFGRVIIEAQACGCLVIGSDSGEIPFVINDSSRIFPEGQFDIFSKILTNNIAMLQGSERSSIKQTIATQAITRYSDRAVAEKLSQKLSEFLSQHSLHKSQSSTSESSSP